ncbi:PAS domain-containing protein [Aestuariispira insulae]|uniref:PAS domain-containing protein n=2 Tax=Aestuariispira insulae TaxID=1461337 RepID=A0A3D9HNM7_9PROT|nr:PAS domain-containing protein [Aestuariispira insulae]
MVSDSAQQNQGLAIRQDEWHVVQKNRDAFFELLPSFQQRAIYRYWEEKMLARGALPGRADFDPVDVYRTLPWLNLVDVKWQPEQGSYRFRQRLIGTALTEKFNRDVTGGWYEDIYHPDYLEDHIRPLLEIIEGRKPCLTRIRFPSPDRKHVIYTRLMLPMASDGENVDLILQVMNFD